MSQKLERRKVLQMLSGGAAAVWIGGAGSGDLRKPTQRLQIAGRAVKISSEALSEHTLRIEIVETPLGAPVNDGALALSRAEIERFKSDAKDSHARKLHAEITEAPLSINVRDLDGRPVQTLRIDQTGTIRFPLGDAALLGMGEGGPQFDRRGDVDRMRSGQGGYRLRTNGGRVPIQWLIGTSGWAIFIHAPLGTFDLSGSEGVFQPASAEKALPLDIFIVDARDPQQAMREYARITGLPEMPPRWSLGYQQSHRTLANADEIVNAARTFREKKLPCDTLIYLGTGFCPSGWNTENGSFQFNPNVFPDPKQQIDQFHSMNFRVVLHAVILTRMLAGTASEPCSLSRFDETQAACYWQAHRKDFADGVDGWWPDEGDPLDATSRLARVRMYYEGPQMDRPNERPFALHRNGYAGMQRYAPFLWSGDIYSTWETLRTQVPVGINTGLSGIPLWGTDIGGFVPTKEFTGELFVRWFQFGAFCPLFRSHGRDWKLRLPWGWNTGEPGPNEVSNYGDAANPDPSELHNADVEPICRKYLELRYRLLPYLYSAVRESHETGLPIMRALWLHYPNDPVAVARSDEYLWGRDILVAPVTEKRASSKKVYLPAGNWFDFWTEEKQPGGQEISRAVDLATMPLFVRAGSIVPFGPVKQHTEQIVDAPIQFVIYPDGNASYTLYEDSGNGFGYRRGEWTKTEARWNDSARTFSLRLSHGSTLAYKKRLFECRVAGDKNARDIEFSGQTVEVKL